MKYTTKIDPVEDAPDKSVLALVDRDGNLEAWDPEFSGRVERDLIAEGNNGPTIMQYLPGMDAKDWAYVWARIESGGQIILPKTQGANPAHVVARKILLKEEGLVVIEGVPSTSDTSLRQLQNLQREILEAVASGWSLENIIDLLCRRVESLAADVVCSVLAVDSQQKLRPLAAPSLPEHFSRAVDGLSIGPCVGSCGTAAYLGAPVEVIDIASDPLWADYKALALPIGLRACWSSPIKGRSGRIVGTFAFYYSVPRGPSALDKEIVETCVDLCAIAIEHEEAQSRIQKLALSDPLTGMPNRTSFWQQASVLLNNSVSEGLSAAIHFIDLDNFKAVNDTFGHSFGDLLLQGVAERFKCCCMENSGFIARLGGDEFAILQSGIRKSDEIDSLAKSTLALFDEPFIIDDHKISVGASIGIARTRADGTTLNELLRHSDVALYRAKSEGQGTYRIFTDEIYQQILARRAVEDDLRKAIGTGEFAVFYQPIIDLASGMIVGFEALVRWFHPTRGLLSPVQFIPIAEETGVIASLGDEVLNTACNEAAGWPKPMRVAVNLSCLQLERPSLVLDIIRALERSKLAANRLDLEITESVRLTENAAMRNVLHQLKEMGIGISLDDFGTGYSSLSYLRSFPFDKIKIDLSFVRDIGKKADAMSIIRAATGLACDLGMRTTAEGIETEEQRAWLVAQNCSEGQGYLFGRPMSAKDLANFMNFEQADACRA